MERLDQGYLNDLVDKAKGSDSNAFAELFAAVAPRQYIYLQYMYGEKEAALEALKEVFCQAFNQLPHLSSPALFMPWISRLSFRQYMKSRIDTDAGNSEPDRQEKAGTEGLNGQPDRSVFQEEGHPDLAELSRIQHLPLAEAQIVLMHRVQHMSIAEVGDILNYANRTVKRFLKIADRHMEPVRESEPEQTPFFGDDRQKINRRGPIQTSAKRSGSMHASGAGSGEIRPGWHAWNIEKKLGLQISAKMLEQIFEAGDQKPNTIPLEELMSYAVYRKERFNIQRGVVVAALIVFLLLPSLFILPRYSVSTETGGERGLPVYTIHVKSLLPVTKVTAVLGRHSLPVYEAGAKDYTVEPIRNGDMKIHVELFNRQEVEKIEQVTEVDSEGPVLNGNRTDQETLKLDVSDAGIGVDYNGIYAVGASGKTYEPIKAGEEDGVVFSYPTEAWDIYIPDHIGNTLHLSLKLE